MSLLGLIHVLLALVALVAGFTIFGLRKGDVRHRVLGWIYFASMLASLTVILARGLSHPVPFHAYAAFVAAGLMAAILMTRLRKRIGAWRSWHAALMSLSMLGTAYAIGGVVVGMALGVATGPVYYCIFDLAILALTAAGLWIINTQPIIWGRAIGPRERYVRVCFNGLVLVASIALVFAQSG